MNIISEDDLKKLFSPHDELSSAKKAEDHFSDTKAEVKYRSSKKRIDEIQIRKIKKQIKKTSVKKSTEKRNTRLTIFLWFCFYTGLVGFVLFGAINFGAFKDRLRWFYFNDYLSQPMPTDLPKITDEPKQDSLTAPELIPQLANSDQTEGLKIDKISLNAPIIWNVDENDILENLKSGVVHYKGTSLPGEGGNVFLTGHSSNYFWIKSDYNQVFSLLDKLDRSDRISINYQNKIYTYEVIDKKEVKPSQVEVLNSTKTEVLTLMTCWPLGTSLNRLIIQAQLLFVSSV